MCSPSTEPARKYVKALDPATYRRHPLHGEGRTWAETNCYTDLLVELLHGLGHEPLAMLAFTLAIDFEGDQWTFFKPPPADLYELYGLDVQELAIWRPLAAHLAEQVDAGRPVLVEVDSFYLPDTAGSAYRLAHAKTTIGVNEIDARARRLGYFHNAGYFVLEGEEFDELLLVAGVPHERVLPPYAELVKWRPGFTAPGGDALVRASLGLLRAHAQRIPKANPFDAFSTRFAADLQWLREAPIESFHTYSFANLRQYGACFELAGSYLRWLASRGVEGMEAPAAALAAIAQDAKAFQFQLARAMARGKPLDLAALESMGARWQQAMDGLEGAMP